MIRSYIRLLSFRSEISRVVTIGSFFGCNIAGHSPVGHCCVDHVDQGREVARIAVHLDEELIVPMILAARVVRFAGGLDGREADPDIVPENSCVRTLWANGDCAIVIPRVGTIVQRKEYRAFRVELVHWR